jgi:hypothetical protein
MPKSAVVNLFFEEIAKEMSFKRLSLFFDDIYINDRSYSMWKIDADYSGNSAEAEKYIQEVEWLIDQGIVKTYSLKMASLRSKSTIMF